MGLRSKVIFNREKQDCAKKTLKNLLLGIAAFGMIEECLLLFLCKNRLAVTLGLLLGVWTAMVNSVYIYRSLLRVLEMDEKNSVKAMRIPVMVRYCFMGIVITIALQYPQIFSPIGVILGLLSMKLSAYIQPFFMEHSMDAPSSLPDESEENEEQSPWGFGIFHHQSEDEQ